MAHGIMSKSRMGTFSPCEWIACLSYSSRVKGFGKLKSVIAVLPPFFLGLGVERSWDVGEGGGGAFRCGSLRPR